jgi:transposase
MSDGGTKKAIISRYYNHPYSIVADTIDKEALRDNGYSLPRTGRPKYYSDTEERLVLRHVQRFPKHIYAEVIKAYRVTFKKDTVKKILKVHGIKN